MSALWFTIGFIAGMFAGTLMMALLAASAANWDDFDQ